MQEKEGVQGAMGHGGGGGGWHAANHHIVLPLNYSSHSNSIPREGQGGSANNTDDGRTWNASRPCYCKPGQTRQAQWGPWNDQEDWTGLGTIGGLG